MSYHRTSLTDWGNFLNAECSVAIPEKNNNILAHYHTNLIARGLGRSFGDSALNHRHQVISMHKLNRFLAFDAQTGVLQAEAGVKLADIAEVFLSKGWHLPIVPETKWITLGGAVANDVHGANHPAAGSFSRYVLRLEILLSDGSLIRCSRSQHPDLFWATVGGLGLLGIITCLEVQLLPLSSSFIKQSILPASNLEETFEIFERKSTHHTYLKAWLDSKNFGKYHGRSLITCGSHISLGELPNTMKDPFASGKVPSHMPTISYMQQTSLGYAYRFQEAKKRPENKIIHATNFFYDGHSWNEGWLYRRKKWLSYHCVSPHKTGISEILHILHKERRPAHQAILTKLGASSDGLLSFPSPGYSLSLIFCKPDGKLLKILNHLDNLLLDYEGKIYLGKDSRISYPAFQKMYSRLPEWMAAKNKYDPNGHFSSDLSRRLRLEPIRA